MRYIILRPGHVRVYNREVSQVMLATLHDARQDALRQDGATLMDQRLGVERLRPWAVETALAHYEVVWLQEEAEGWVVSSS